MANAKKRSRLILTTVTALLVGGALTAAFWPRPTMVDMGTVTRATMQMTIDEEGRTRVRNAYIVSTPVAGQLQRVSVKPGDPVIRGETVVAHMRPTNPAALDVRTREQAQTELTRTEKLVERGIASTAALDYARQSARIADASVDTAKAAISMRVAEISNVQAQLISFDDPRLIATLGAAANDIPLYAPASGTILRLIQQSETSLPAGAPVMEIGNIGNDLEVVVGLLSTDAVQVTKGDRVIIADWGGAQDLAGEVTRVDPFGVTQFSALGVEKQRVNDGTATQSRVEIGQNNGLQAHITNGLSEGDRVILYPSSGLSEGISVAQRVIN